MAKPMEDGRRLRILVVEDHADSARMLETILGKWGYEASVVGSCAGASQAAAARDFDLAMCDIQLPDGDGAALMRELRQERGVRCIAVTAHVTQPETEAYVRDGIEHVLPKPYTFAQLRGVLERALGGPGDSEDCGGFQSR